MVYDGFGGMVAASRTIGNPVADEHTLDALGNVVHHDRNRNANDAGRSTDNQSFSGPRLQLTASDPLSTPPCNGTPPVVTTLDTTSYGFDASGNTVATNRTQSVWNRCQFGTDIFNPDATGQRWTRSYYDGAERLRVTQTSAYITVNGGPALRTTFQENFYDALGRRVTVRTRRDSTCDNVGDPLVGSPDCLQTIERFAWDGPAPGRSARLRRLAAGAERPEPERQLERQLLRLY
jgi:hypothetical protein